MGKPKKPKIEVTEYFLSHHLGICHGVPDALLKVIIKEKDAWVGNQTTLGPITIDQPELFGGASKEGGAEGICYYLPGADDQVLPDVLAQRMGRANGADCPGYRGLASLFFVGDADPAFKWGANTPYLPGIWARLKRIFIRSDGSEQWYPETAEIPFIVQADTPYAWIYVDANLNAGANNAEAVTRGLELTGFDPLEEVTFIPARIDPDGNIYPSVWQPGNGSWTGDFRVYLDGSTSGYLSGTTGQHAGLSYTYSLREPITLVGGSTYTFAVIDTNYSDNLHGLGFARLGTVSGDMNPAHIIRECLTDRNWGMGTSEAAVDDTAFRAAALTLYEESFGLSLIWREQLKIEEFVQEILDHIQGVLYVDPSTGLITLTLIRDDYDSSTLDIITPANGDLNNFSRKLWGDIVNEIVVTWTNPENEQEETISVQDDASIATQGGIISDSRNYYGVRNAALAQRLAYRDLRSAGQPLASCEVELDRSQWQLRPASVVKLTWPEYGLTELVMRVQSVDYGRPGDPTIKVSMIEDVYGLDIGSYDEPPSSSWVDPSADPTAMDPVDIITLPYYFSLDSGSAPEVPEYPQVLAGILATSDNADAFGYELYGEVTLPNGSLEWQSLSSNNVIGYGTLTAALDAEALTAGVAFSDMIGATTPVIGGFVVIGASGEAVNEIALIDDDTSNYDLIRGTLDTVPRSWAAGTPVWFLSSSTVYEDPTVRSAAEVVEYKLLTRTSQGVLALGDAALETATLSERPWLPNRPANVVAYGQTFSTQTFYIDAIDRVDPWVTVSWAIRNRLEEEDTVLSWTAAGHTAETGQTTTIEVRDAVGTLLTTHDGLTGSTFDVPDSSFGTEDLVELRVYSERTDADGSFVSLQYFSHWVQVASGPRLTETGDTRYTEAGDIRLLEN